MVQSAMVKSAMAFHPTAIIDSTAKVPASCTIGPYCVIGPEVELGEKCELISHVVIHGPTKIGKNNRIFPFSALGLEPQDITFTGQRVHLEIGDNNIIRQSVTLSRANKKR